MNPPGGRMEWSAAVALAMAAAFANLLLLMAMALGVFPMAGLREREIPLVLPTVVGGTSQVRFGPREVIIHVGPSGDIRIGGSPVGVERLAARLSGLSAEGAETTVTVRADARAPYGTVAQVLAAVRSSGVRDVSLLTIEPPAVR